MELEELKGMLSIKCYEENRESMERTRKAFVEHFSLERIKSMTVDDYVVGKNNSDSFLQSGGMGTEGIRQHPRRDLDEIWYLLWEIRKGRRALLSFSKVLWWRKSSRGEKLPKG